jgi:hypothetical protein
VHFSYRATEKILSDKSEKSELKLSEYVFEQTSGICSLLTLNQNKSAGSRTA